MKTVSCPSWWPIPLLLLAAARPVAAQTPAQVVQAFLGARAAGQLDQAYALLSPASRKLIPLSLFKRGDVSTPESKDPDVTPPAKAVMDVIADTHNQEGYRFTVQGAAPDDARAVLLSARLPGATDVVTFRLVTVPDALSGGAPRIDLDATAEADPVLRRARERAKQTVSQNNLKQICLGILQYCQDHDEHYPQAAHWVDEIMPYVMNQAIFHDPSSASSQPYSYAFNRNLSGKSLALFDSPASTVAVFETTKSVKNASDTGQSVPRPGRHSGGTDYGFADGHVKWVQDGTKLSYLLSGK